MDATITGFAQDHFGEQAADVVRAVLESMSEAQAAGCRAQQASGMDKRFTYGSVWPRKYELLVESLQDLDGAETETTNPATYRLVRVNGRLLVPFKLASSLPGIPKQPKLDSKVLLALAARTTPKPAPPATLFDELTAKDERPVEPSEVEEPEATPQNHPPVFIGLVANADSDTLLAIYWGTAISLSEEGVLKWRPESLPLQLVPEPRKTPLRAVPDASTVSAPAPSFSDSEVPSLEMEARDEPLDESSKSDDVAEDDLPRPRPTGEQDD